jgi:hypothetical protein
MKLHTRLTYGQVHQALHRAQTKGKITQDVTFVTDSSDGMIGPNRSQTHARSFEIQLGTHNKTSLPAGYTDQNGHKMKVRRFKNSGGRGATSGLYGNEPVWAATYDEWGWFIMEVFGMDPEARFGGLGKSDWGYRSLDDFHAKTDGRFK